MCVYMMCACAQCLCGSQRTTWCGFWDQSQVPRFVWQVSDLISPFLPILPTWSCFFATKRTSGLSWAWQSNALHKLTFRMSSPWTIWWFENYDPMYKPCQERTASSLLVWFLLNRMQSRKTWLNQLYFRIHRAGFCGIAKNKNSWGDT